MITERINIDVRPGGVPIVVHVTQYEVGLRTFEFVPFTSSGEWTDVTGSATLEGTKPDGNAFQQACTYVDGIVTYVLQEQLCAVSGRVWSRLVIRNIDGDMIGMTAIVWDVGEAGVADDAVMSDSDISALRQFLDEFGTIDAYRGALNGALAAVGGPLVAATASAMTDTTKVYVYTGSESGYTEGHWYYWNGSAWTDGGVYQSTGINTDKTLTVEDMAADAKATGDAVAELKNDLKGALGVTNESMGVYTAEHYSNNSARWAIIPFNFENGKSYFIDVRNSANNLSEIRIASAGNLSTDTKIKSWSVSGVKNYSVTYNCNVDNATHLIIITPSTNTSISVDYAISQFNIIELNSRIGTAEGEIASLKTDDAGIKSNVFANRAIGFQKNISYTITSSGVVFKFGVTSANASGFIYQPNGESLGFSPVKYGTLSDGEYIFTVPNNNILVIDLADRQDRKAQINVKAVNALSLNDIVLVHYFLSDTVSKMKGVLGDLLEDKYLQSEIDGIQSQIDNMMSPYPAYYDANDYFANKVTKINKNAPLNGGIFSFITDMHFGANQTNSLKLLKALEKQTALRMIICGGDFIDAYGSDAVLNDDIEKVYLYANELYPNWIALRGNHDFTIRTSAGATIGKTLDDAVTYNAIVRTAADWRYEVPVPEVSILNDTHHIYKNYCWMLTNEQAKIKIIGFCDFPGTNKGTYWGVKGVVTNAYAKYLAQMLLTCNGYNVIVVTHAALSERLDGTNSNATKVCKAFAEKGTLTLGSYAIDFTQSTANFLFSLSGHSHRDQFLYENSIIHFNSTCDATFNNDPNVTRTAGTINEQAFDVFNIDTDSRIAYATRIGGGYDRILHCDPVSVSSSVSLSSVQSGTIVWESSDTSIATVSSGTVTKLSTGQCYVTATGEDGTVEYWAIKDSN